MPIVGDLDIPDAAGDHLNNFGNPPNNFGDPPNNTRELDSRELSGTQQEHTELVPLMRIVFYSIDHTTNKARFWRTRRIQNGFSYWPKISNAS